MCCVFLARAKTLASFVALPALCQVRVFRHNDARHLDRVLRDSISSGQPRTHRPWKKVGQSGCHVRSMWELKWDDLCNSNTRYSV